LQAASERCSTKNELATFEVLALLHLNCLYISALSSPNADKEFSCPVVISEITNNTTSEVCTCTAEVSQGIELNTDNTSLEESVEQKLHEDKKQNDNNSICADKDTCKRDHKDQKFPRLVDSSNFFTTLSCASAVPGICCRNVCLFILLPICDHFKSLEFDQNG